MGVGPLSSLASGLLLGVPLSIPPGPAGVIILNRALRGATAEALRAMGALLGAELLVMTIGLLSFRGVAALAAQPWMKPAAGLFLIGFAVNAWRTLGTERGFAATSAWAVFRVTLLNPMIWLGAVSVLTIAPGDLAAGLLTKLLFIAGLEAGSLAWFLAVILGARRVPGVWRQRLERAAVLAIGLSGVYFASSLPRVLSAVR